MTLLITFLVDAAGVLDGGRFASANKPVREFVETLPNDTLVRIIRYSDTAMWHIGPEPVFVRDLEWVNIPAGGYLTSLAHAVNLAGQTLSSEKRGERSILVLISSGAMSDPEEVFAVVLKKYFSESNVERYAIPLNASADETVLKLFAGENVLPSTTLSSPNDLLLAVGEKNFEQKSSTNVSLTCTILVDDKGSSISVTVNGADMNLAKDAMRDALRKLCEQNEKIRESVKRYISLVL